MVESKNKSASSSKGSSKTYGLQVAVRVRPNFKDAGSYKDMQFTDKNDWAKGVITVSGQKPQRFGPYSAVIAPDVS